MATNTEGFTTDRVCAFCADLIERSQIVILDMKTPVGMAKAPLIFVPK